MTDRRSFIKNLSIAAMSTALFPEILNASQLPSTPLNFKKNAVILFQGDSITDGQRKRGEHNLNTATALGNGYVLLAGAELLAKMPQKNFKIYNRGIGGNKVFQLSDRWQTDCYQLKPDVLSILIGVNDFWHHHQNRYSGDIKIFNRDYAKLLQETKAKLPQTQLIIGEPFAINGVGAVNKTWYPQFTAYQHIVKELAHQFNARFIPYQKVFDNACQLAKKDYWTYDGVHPTMAGNALMAQTWLRTVGF